jgi:hypothetical protein
MLSVFLTDFRIFFQEASMRKFRKIHLLGIGVLTPSLVGQTQSAEARPAVFTEPLKLVAANASTAKLVEILKEEFFALTPSEKIKIGGDRIRLAQLSKSTQAPVKNLPGATPPKVNNGQNLRVSVDGDGCTANCAGSRINAGTDVRKASMNCVSNACANSQIKFTANCTSASCLPPQSPGRSGTQLKQ